MTVTGDTRQNDCGSHNLVNALGAWLEKLLFATQITELSSAEEQQDSHHQKNKPNKTVGNKQ